MDKIKNWLNKKEFWILVAILIVAAFSRLYKIDQYMTFLGDEGRDVIIVRRFLVEHHPPLIGPGTSVGGMYLGPLYYYMMAPALLLANFSPVGPAVLVALLGVVTVFLIWWVGREWFGEKAGLISAGLYAISPTVIIFSRSSWNPNIMPFFALLSIYSIWRVFKKQEYVWLPVLGIAFAFVLQSHYLGILLVPTLLLFWVTTLKSLRKPASFIKKSLLGFTIFAILMSPLLLFDIRHGWTNFSAFKIFLTSHKDVGLPLLAYFSKAGGTGVMLISNLLTVKNLYLGGILLLAFVLIFVWLQKSKRMNSQFALLFFWITTGVLGVALYRGPIYDHYLGFLFPAPFLLFGGVVEIFRKFKVTSWITFTIFFLLVFVNLKNSPILSSPNMQLPRTIAVAKVIEEKARGQKFNLATISDLNNRDVYQYFLIIWGAKVVDTDPSSTKFTVTDQLFVVCEKPREVCDPIHDPSAWITNFGWTKIVSEWEVWGGTLFKLGHTL